MFKAGAVWVAVATVLLTARVGWSQLPPGPPAAGAYEWRPDLGGYLDTSTNLVWGYSVTSTVNINVTYNGALSYAANYGSTLTNAGYPDEGAIASQFTWRLPSVSEYESAWSKGLFWRSADGTTGFHDDSPAAGWQSACYGGTKFTSTLGVKKENKLVKTFNTCDGTKSAATKTSALNAIAVRTHVPPAP